MPARSIHSRDAPASQQLRFILLCSCLTIPLVHCRHYKLLSNNSRVSQQALVESRVVETRLACSFLCTALAECRGFSVSPADAGDGSSSSFSCNLTSLSPAVSQEATSYESKYYFLHTDPPGPEDVFREAAKGRVSSPIAVFESTDPQLCRQDCRTVETCPGYSVTYLALTKKYECRIAPSGLDTYWTPDVNSTLYLEKIPSALVTGYDLVADGRYYRVVQSSLVYSDAAAICARQGGSIMAFYPKPRADVLLAYMNEKVPGFDNTWILNALGQGTSGSGTLFLPALDIEITPKAEPDQPWLNGVVPTLTAASCPKVTFPSGAVTWNAADGCSVARYSGCTLKHYDLFKFAGNGEVDDPAQQRLVRTERECARTCNALGLPSCMGYSTKLLADGSKMYSCRIPKPGELYWTGDPGAKLYNIPPFATVPTGFALAEDGRYYKVVASALSSSSALTACRAQSGDLLAMPYPAKRAEKLAKVMQTAGVTAAWTGGLGRSDGLFTLDLSGEGIKANASDKNQIWDPSSSPPTTATTSDCVAVAVSANTSGGAGVWKVQPCSGTQPAYICEVSPPYFPVRSTGKWYKVNRLPHATYYEAQEYCMREGGNLADTYGSNGLPKLQFAMSTVLNAGDAWVCGTDIAVMNQYRQCFDSQTFSPSVNANQQHWMVPEPNHAGVQENFIKSALSSGAYGWMDEPAGKNPCGFVCQLPY